MRPHSFRLRLALLSACISGVLFVGVGIAAWLVMHRQLVRIVDATIELPVSRIISHVDRHARWDDFDRRMDILLSDDTDRQEFAVIIHDNWGDGVFYEAGKHEWLAESLDVESYLPDRETLEDFDRSVPDRKPPPPRDGPPHRARPEDRERPDGRRRPPRRGTMPSLGPAYFTTEPGPDETSWRISVQSNPDVTVFFAMNLSEFDAEEQRTKRLFLASLPFGLLAIGLGSWIISRQAIRPVNRVAEAADRITASGLDKRIPKRGTESAEFSRLIDVFNGMTERLEKNFHQATRFTADASHELKTPIALMQAEINSALRQCEHGSPEEEALHSVAEEVNRLKRIVQSLLLLSQVDSGGLRLSRETISLSDEMQALCEDAELLCHDAGLDFAGDIAEGLRVNADRTLFMQAVQNLLSNAIKYNHEGGQVTCSAKPVNGEVRITFRNSGPAIPKKHQSEIFDRFVRGDEARNREVDGFGLGLNIAREIVRAHGGELKLLRSDDSGTEFSIIVEATGPEDLPQA